MNKKLLITSDGNSWIWDPEKDAGYIKYNKDLTFAQFSRKYNIYALSLNDKFYYEVQNSSITAVRDLSESEYDNFMKNKY